VLRTTKGVNITTFNYDKGQKQENLPLINWCEETRCWLLDLVCDAIAGLVQYFLFHRIANISLKHEMKCNSARTHNILKEQEMLLHRGIRNVMCIVEQEMLFCYGFAWFDIRGLWFVFLC
jgi:hypothetical protein